jgi:hypothetical protein
MPAGWTAHLVYAHLVCNMITIEAVQSYKCMPSCSALVANYQTTKLQALSTKLCSSQLMESATYTQHTHYKGALFVVPL